MRSIVTYVIKRLHSLLGRMNEEIWSREHGPSALNYHSSYISRFPHFSTDFDRINRIASAARFEQVARDREFHHFFEHTMAYVASGAPMSPQSRGDYYEFGCCSATSFRIALSKAYKWGLDDMHFHAFDSFQGLPTDGTLAIKESDFRLMVEEHGINVDKVVIHPGFYENALTEDLQKKFLATNREAKIVNIDCDLYESAVPVFKFISPLIGEGSIIFLDDYWVTFDTRRNFGTAKAFTEFAAAHPTLGFHPFINCGWWGMSFIAYNRAAFPEVTLALTGAR